MDGSAFRSEFCFSSATAGLSFLLSPFDVIGLIMIRRLERIFRWLTWCAVVALALLSWTPSNYMVRPGWGHHLEHVTAYLMSSVVASLGYGRRISYTQVAALLCAYAGLLEIGQNWSPGRTPAFDDFAASSIGTLFGVTLTWLWLTYRPLR